MAPSRALLQGGAPSLAIIAAVVLAQRVALPLSVLWLGERGYLAAAAALFGAAAASFIRARAADRLARAVRLNLLELYLRPFERGSAVSLPGSETLTPRLAVALPTLVSWAVEGVAVLLGAAAAVPLVAALIASALGAAALVPLGVAGAVGAGVTMAASRRVEDAWGRAWERSRALLSAVGAGFDGAIDLRAHGRAHAFAERLRADVTAWSTAEGRARTVSAISSWGALGATLGAALLSGALFTPGIAPAGEPMYRAFLLVLAAIPTLQAVVGAIANVLYARDELEIVERQRALAAETAPDEIDEPIDATAELRLEGIDFAYPAPTRAPGGVGKVAPFALRGASLLLPPRASLAVVGPNGAGKTTLLYVLLGVVRPDRGRVLVGGREARLDNRRYRERVAFLSQRPFELPEATVAENLRAFDPGVTNERLIAALEMVGLWPALRARASSDVTALDLPYAALSRGQSRRVMLARALLRDADLLVLDEPEAHLDQGSTADLIEVLRRIARERRVVAAVHDPALMAFATLTLELRPAADSAPASAELP